MENCLKVVVLGGNTAGKTSLVLVKTKHKFPYRRVPRLADPTIVRTRIDGKTYTFSVWDTKKIELCEQLHCPGPGHTTDVFMLCFAVDDRPAFQALTHKWLPQLKTRFPFVPVVLVACKVDMRSYPSASSTKHVTYEEGNTVAEQHGSIYCETSALHAEGVTECFNLAVRYADLNLDKRDNPGALCSCIPSRSRSYLHVHMVRPPDIPPEFEILSSTFADDWLETLKDGKHCDVTCLLQGQEFGAHQVMLCSASGFFCRLFQTGRVFTNIPSPVASFIRDAVSRHSTIHIDSSISPEVFKLVLEFLYTGSASKLSNNEEKREIAMDLINVARMFELIELKTICENVLNEREYLNPSVGSAVCDRTGARLKDLFLNCVDTSDVVFIVKGKRLYANKVVLSTRCDVMTRMFSGNFKESKSELTVIEIPNFTTESFLLFLEYLYSDHVNLENTDVFEVLKIADMYCQTRLLTMCEYCVSRKAQSWTLRKRADLVFQVLLCVQAPVFANQARLCACVRQARVYNFLQSGRPFNTMNLINWCLFELSKHTDKVRAHKDYGKLSVENRRAVEARGSLQGGRDQRIPNDNHSYRKHCVIL